jgi:CRP-like cAMP-binding protein
MFTTRKLRDGDVLYGAGDVQDTVYVVVSGRVEMREPPAAGAKLGADGKPEKRVLRTLEPGAAFNAESLLHDVIPTHEACAESPTVLCACARVHFEQIMQLSPAVAAAVADMARRHAEYLAPASLRTAWPLCRVSDEDVALLADGAFRVDVVPAQTKLFSAPGSACSSLFVVLHGTVAVAKESGVEHVSAGSLFGATSLLEDINAEARPRLLHATTMDDSAIAVLTAEALAGVMKRTPSVKDALRGMADAWLAARSATALSRMWLMAPLLAACSSKGDGMQPFRTLSAAVTTRLVGAGVLRDLTPTACVHGKLVATQRPPGVAPELRELQSGEWCAAELVLAGTASWTEEAEAEDSCVITSLPAGMLSELATDFPGVEDATLAMLAEFRAGLTSDALKALGLTGIDAEDLEMLPGFCSAHVLTPGKQVFEGRGSEPWIARVLWGEVRGSKGVLKPGTTFGNQRAASLATGAPADAAAAAGGNDPLRAQLLAETAAPEPKRRGSHQPPPRPPPPPAPTAVSMAPKAVVALYDVGALTGKIMEERRRRAAELRAAALARAMQLERIRGMRRDTMVLRLALEQGKLPEARAADGASAGPRRRGLALFRCVAVRIGLACRLRSSATIVGTLDEAEADAREQLTQVEAEYARRTAERESLVAQLRAAWEELEVPGSPHVPPLAAREFEATNGSVTRANMALLRDALDAAQAARDARAANIASVLDAANVMLADLGPEDDEDDDSAHQEGHAAAAARLAAPGLQRAVQAEVLALCAALHAERNRRLALQGEARRELAEVREVLAAMRPAYDASDDELARLPTPQPTLVALRAHQEAVIQSRRSMEPDIARARDELALMWAQLDIPTERRAPLLPTPGEAPSAALLQALQREVRHLNDAADIASHLMFTSPAKPADEPYRTVGGVLVGPIRIGGLRVRESDALLEEAASAQPTVDAIAAALYTRPEAARRSESAAAAEAERAAAAELAATAKLAILQEAAVKQVARSSTGAPRDDA